LTARAIRNCLISVFVVVVTCATIVRSPLVAVLREFWLLCISSSAVVSLMLSSRLCLLIMHYFQFTVFEFLGSSGGFQCLPVFRSDRMMYLSQRACLYVTLPTTPAQLFLDYSDTELMCRFCSCGLLFDRMNEVAVI